MKFIVLKPIPTGDGSSIASGTVIDGGKWRNTRQLVAGRYLAPVVEDVVEEKPKKVKLVKAAETDTPATDAA